MQGNENKEGLESVRKALLGIRSMHYAMMIAPEIDATLEPIADRVKTLDDRNQEVLAREFAEEWGWNGPPKVRDPFLRAMEGTAFGNSYAEYTRTKKRNWVRDWLITLSFSTHGATGEIDRNRTGNETAVLGALQEMSPEDQEKIARDIFERWFAHPEQYQNQTADGYREANLYNLVNSTADTLFSAELKELAIANGINWWK